MLETAREEIRQVPKVQGVSREVWIWLDGKGWVVRKRCKWLLRRLFSFLRGIYIMQV